MTRGNRALPAVAAGILAVVILALAFGVSEGRLRDSLAGWTYWILGAQLLALVGLTWLELPRAIRSARPSAVGTLVVLGCALTSALLTTFVAPRTNRIYYDEHIYQSVGRSLSERRIAQICHDGSVEYGRLQCASGDYNKEPSAFPMVLSTLYSVAGVTESAGFALNIALTAALIVIVALLALLLTGDSGVMTGAALAMTILPEPLIWGHTVAAEPLAALTAALAVLATLHFTIARTLTSRIWMVAAVAFALSVRPESVLVAPLALFAILLWARREFTSVATWWTAVAAIAAVALVPIHLAAVRHEGWGTTGARLSLEFAVANFRSNAGFYLADERFPVVVTLLAAVGLAFDRRRRSKLFLSAWFLLFWGIFLCFYAGSYDYGADVRYSLLTVAPLAILAGMGWTEVLAQLTRVTSSRMATLLAVAPLALSLAVALPLVRAVGEESWNARADVDVARAWAADLPANAYVLTHNPTMFHVWGKDAGQLSLKDDAAVMERLRARYAGGVYMYWDYWCAAHESAITEECRRTLDAFPHETIREATVRDQRFALYRLTLPTGQTTAPVDPSPPGSRPLPHAVVPAPSSLRAYGFTPPPSKK